MTQWNLFQTMYWPSNCFEEIFVTHFLPTKQSSCGYIQIGLLHYVPNLDTLLKKEMWTNFIAYHLIFYQLLQLPSCLLVNVKYLVDWLWLDASWNRFIFWKMITFRSLFPRVNLYVCLRICLVEKLLSRIST